MGISKGLLFTYLLTYGGSLVSLFDPFIGLLIYVSFAILKPEALWYWAVKPGNYSRIVAIALLVGWLVNGCGRWNLGRAKSIVWSLVGFLLWGAFSAVQADDQAVAWARVEGLAKMVLPFVVGLSLVDSVQKLKQLAWVIVLSHGYLAYEFNLSYYSGFNRVLEGSFAQMDNNCMAITMVTSAGLAFFLGLQTTRWWSKVLAWASAALMVHVVLFSFSRGGMLGLIIVAVVSFWLIPKKPQHYAVFALAVLLALRLAGPEVVKRFSSAFVDKSERDASAQSRLIMWGYCLKLMQEKPLFGVGPNNFPLQLERFGMHEYHEAHSVWLTVGAEEGIPALLLLVYFYGTCVWRLLPFRRERTPVADPWFRHSARMVIASLVGFAVSAQFVSLVGLEAPYYVVLLGAGTLKLASWSPGLAAPAPLRRSAFPERPLVTSR